MGSCFSKSNHSGGHTLVDSPSPSGPNTGIRQPPPSDPRTAAAEAAERRLKASQNRGVSAANPNQGRLAAQVESCKKVARIPESRDEERLVWD